MAKKKKAVKKASERDYEVIGFRLSKKEKSQILKRAEAESLSLSQYLRLRGTGAL